MTPLLDENGERFVRWALDDARTIEERYTIELLVEQGARWWNSNHKIYKDINLDEIMERNRERALNPAYHPAYTETNVRKAAEVFPLFKDWNAYGGHNQRPVRDLKALRFLPNLETLGIHMCEVTDLSPLAELPKLRGLQFGSTHCEDYSPLAGCSQLRELSLFFWRTFFKSKTMWPNVAGLDSLVQLEFLSLEGNLLVFPRSTCWPKVRRGSLICQPLDARDVRELPQLPACEFLTLGGVERLDGIEAFPKLRNLTIETVVRDFAPLEALRELTSFTCKEFEPLDVSPLTRIPKLQSATFDTWPKTRIIPVKPRDFSPLTDAPMLRELHVKGCPPVESEVAAINAALQQWDDVFLAPRARPLPHPLRMCVAPWNKHPLRREVALAADDSDLPDYSMRECEGRWVGKYLARAISNKLGESDWGNATANGTARHCSVTVESFAVVEKFLQIIEATREALTELRHDYEATVMIDLKAPKIKLTPAQKELDDKFRREQDDAEYEQGCRDREEYVDRLHRMELKKQAGEKIDPKDFRPAPRAGAQEQSDDEEEEEQGTESFSGDIALQKKPEPPIFYDDDDHPLAENYRLMATLTLSEIWFAHRHRDLAVYLMQREPDLVIPEEPKE